MLFRSDDEMAAEGRIASERMVRNSLYFGRKRVAGRKGGKGRKAIGDGRHGR